MNFPLSGIESHVDEDCLLLGEQLLEQGKVGNYSEIERHLWLIEVEDGSTFEVEVRISPSRVIQASCECARFRAGGSCPHFAAALLGLRRRLADQKEQKQAVSAKKERRARSLGTAHILESISHEDLAVFVHQYAKANRSFAIALKTRFAPSVPSPDNKAKFVELLESAIGASRKADRSFSARGIRKILGVAEEMLGQMKQAVVRQHYADAVDMAQSLIEKLTPLLRKSGDQEQELRAVIHAAFAVLRESASGDAPPALLDAMRSYAVEESQKLLYRNNGIDRLFLRLLAALCRSSTDEEQLRSATARQLDKYLLEGREPSALVLLLLQQLEQAGNREEAQDLVEKYLSSPEVLLFAVRNAAAGSDWNRMVFLAEAGLRLALPPAVVAELEEMLLQDALRTHHVEKATRLAQSRFFKTLDVKFYRMLRSVHSDHRRQQPDAVLEQLRRLPFSHAKRQAIAAVLATENRRDELLDYLRETRSLDLLAEFGAALLPEKEAELIDMYRQLLGQYLRGHVGPKPSRRVREIVEELYRNGASAIATQLVEMIRAEYPERHTLQEELQIF